MLAVAYDVKALIQPFLDLFSMHVIHFSCLLKDMSLCVIYVRPICFVCVCGGAGECCAGECGAILNREISCLLSVHCTWE